MVLLEPHERELEPWTEATGEGNVASARTPVPKEKGSREETAEPFLSHLPVS